VRAAVDGGAGVAGAAAGAIADPSDGGEIEMLRSLTGRSLSRDGTGAALGRSVFFRSRAAAV